jgi:hypothetical protein
MAPTVPPPGPSTIIETARERANYRAEYRTDTFAQFTTFHHASM